MPTWQSDTFAYAESYDEVVGRYRGLRAGQMVNVAPDAALLLKPSVARQQLEFEILPAGPTGGSSDIQPVSSLGGGSGSTQPKSAAMPRRIHGYVTLDTTRVGRDAGRIAEEVIAHLSGKVGAEVTVTIEINAVVPSGAPDNVVRSVTENFRTLKFSDQGFEEEW